MKLRTEPIFGEWFFEVLQPKLASEVLSTEVRGERVIIEVEDTPEVRKTLAECEDVQWSIVE